MKKNIDDLIQNINLTSRREDEVKLIAEFILRREKRLSPDNGAPAQEIYEKYQEISKKHPNKLPVITPETFRVYLSMISKRQDTEINIIGRKGYYLESLASEIEDSENTILDDLPEEESLFREENIYPFIKQWLIEKGHDRVADISSRKNNGKWGNPDVIGINIEEIYSKPEIEITTVEAKLTDESWEHWIFEAISHTRFANKAYFCFIHPETLINKLDASGMKLYAEHYGIGVLVLAISNENYTELKNKQLNRLAADEVNIIEYHPAPTGNPHIKFRRKFYESLDILELKKLYEFGEAIKQ
ncbi:hypothetical protein A3750_13115 [Oleiphilus sp. HI0079]|uniref:hypothetical protein n=1 Tax=Oleiphilus sp. HI0079 TaxID=1822254 RepID=UPI0007C2FE48|nr:hypothetical protein [Oleiphilus sp. HI0079]KZZ14866.1 hypothetical protein A3750_13115 [Oleiphilus sp. HI0079]